MRGGIFKKHGLDIEVLYTQGGPELHQAVISGSMDLACGGGIESAIGAYSRGAPLRIIGSEMIGSPDTYWYVLAKSPIKSLADAVRQDHQLFAERLVQPHRAAVADRAVPRRRQAGRDRRPSDHAHHGA